LNNEGERGSGTEVVEVVEIDATAKGRTEVSTRSVREDVDMVGIDWSEGGHKGEGEPN
jgi:hypothetical protein